jgi:hypothetical protein
MENKIVIHMKGGTVHKGITQDFDPTTRSFHLLPAEGGGVPVRIEIENDQGKLELINVPLRTYYNK